MRLFDKRKGNFEITGRAHLSLFVRRNIARFTGLPVTGVTINKYQVGRGNELNAQAGLETLCRSVQGDFMQLPFPDASFDGVYAIEATCHAPDRTKVFAEIFRVLKPGQTFACYEWCLTG